MTDGLVSIVIPAYNPGRYLSEALESAFAQTYQPIEVIVVDDGSTEDLTSAVCMWPRARLLRQANLGVAAARNTGARASEGQYLVFLDADDRLLPEAVAAGLTELTAQPAAAFAAGLCRPIGPSGERLAFREQAALRFDPYVEMLTSNYIWMPAQVLYRREVFEASGGFDTSLNACADYDLYLRLTRTHAIACHRRAVAEYRVHHKNMSSDPALMLSSVLDALDRQWPYVKKEPTLRWAYWEGRRFWRQFYGGALVEDIRAGLKSPGSRFRALRGAAILLRHDPREALRQFGRKLRCLALDVVGTAR